MILPWRFLSTNNWLCLALGSVFNAALLWLLARHTPAAMATHYRPILVLSCITDFVDLAIRAVVVPVLLADTQGWMALFPIGPLVRWLPQPFPFAAVATNLFCFAFVLYSPAVSFIYRYGCICRGREWKPRHYFAMLSVPLAIAAGYVVVLAKVGYTRSGEEQREAWKKVFLDDTANDTGQTIEGKFNDHYNSEYQQNSHYFIPAFLKGGSTIAASMGGFLLVDYIVVFFCGWRIYRHLTHLAEGHMSGDDYRALQIQLSSALLLQAVVPLVVMFAPTMAFVNFVFGVRNARELAAYKVAVDAWMPVLNPLIAIWVVKAYRGAIANRLKRFRPSAWGQRTATVHAGGDGGGVASQQKQQKAKEQPDAIPIPQPIIVPVTSAQ